jgi:hypothetical protein
MGSRFSTVTEYHSIITAHGVLAAITFLFILPVGVMVARFYRGRPGSAIRYHAYFGVLTLGFTTVIFILGFIAVGPNRALTNPHHGIGVAIYVLMILTTIGGSWVRKITGHSLRVVIHNWFGRMIALLGIVQVPLGLTLYGSPKFTFVLYTLWMTFLLLLYFILDYRLEAEHYRTGFIRDGRSEAGHTQFTEQTEVTERKRGGVFRWLAPLAAGAGAFALFRRRRDRGRSQSRSRSRSRIASRSRSRRRPEVIPSRRGSESFIEEEKVTGRRRSGGNWTNRLLGVGAAVGAGALVNRLMQRRERRQHDEEYSAVATDTPSRRNRLRRPGAEVSEVSERTDVHDHGRRTPLLPGPGRPPIAGESIRTDRRHDYVEPATPSRSHRPGMRRGDTMEESEYSSYVSPSRRPTEKTGGWGTGILTGVGLGWMANRWQNRRNRKNEQQVEEDRYEEEQRRAGATPGRFTGDGYPTPTRRDSRRLQRPGGPPGRATTISHVSEVSSSEIEPRPPVPGYNAHGPPMPPLGPSRVPGGSGPILPVPVPGREARSQSRSRFDSVPPAVMPAMPPDPRYESGSEAYDSAGGRTHRRHSSAGRRAAEVAGAAAVGAGAAITAEQIAAARRRADASTIQEETRTVSGPRPPVAVKVNVNHDDRDRNVTLRRLTEDEAAAARRDRRRRADSASSISGAESPAPAAGRHYRRDASQRRAEAAAEGIVDPLAAPLAPLSPPNPAFAAGRRPKDSAYYSGQPGPSGATPAAGATVSSFGSPGSHGTPSGLSPSPSGARDTTASAAERRRRRRLERRDPRQPNTVDFE